jgi:predicted nucleic acid-binding protein
MNNLVCIDSQIFIWGIKKQSNPTQVDKIGYASRFIDKLSEANAKLLLPVPMLTELLAPVPVSEHADIIRLMDKRFITAPFDNLAATKCAELLHTVSSSEELRQYKEEHKIPKAKIKYDCMIAAIAITRRAAVIYSNDSDLKKFACGQIRVINMPEYGVQTNLFGDIMKDL